mmetsp:Transcript_45996/g.78247  ORF Transcript_45996/g.78247 Transcript_45996/m.78247 type:complete len:137 (+) Transcript_45996:517-927(+)
MHSTMPVRRGGGEGAGGEAMVGRHPQAQGLLLLCLNPATHRCSSSSSNSSSSIGTGLCRVNGRAHRVGSQGSVRRRRSRSRGFGDATVLSAANSDLHPRLGAFTPPKASDTGKAEMLPPSLARRTHRKDEVPLAHI